MMEYVYKNEIKEEEDWEPGNEELYLRKKHWDPDKHTQRDIHKCVTSEFVTFIVFRTGRLYLLGLEHLFSWWDGLVFSIMDIPLFTLVTKN